jgi:hypothetical protein
MPPCNSQLTTCNSGGRPWLYRQQNARGTTRGG